MAKRSWTTSLSWVLLVAVGMTAGAVLEQKFGVPKAGGPVPAAGASHSRSSRVHTAGATGAPKVPQVPGQRHGVVFGMIDRDFVNEPPQLQAQQLARMRSLGIRSLRLDINWRWIQPHGPTTYNWAALDPEVHAVLAAHMRVDAVIDGCPSWAAVAGSSGSPSPQPASASEFATWAAQVAEHYGAMGVKYFEIWNEPNDVKYWQPAANPVVYTQMLKAAYTAMKSVDKSAFIISGGLAPVSTGHGSYDPISFLKAMYANGAKGHFDAVGDHPYSYPTLPSTFETWSAWSQMAETTPSIRSVMRQYGDSSKKIWITEFGAPSKGPAGIGTWGQAAEFRQAISLAAYTKWIGAIYLYTWQDIKSNDGPNAGYFGLLTLSGTPKPAFVAVAAAIRRATRR